MKKKLIALTLAMTALTMAAGAEDYTLRAGDQLNIIVTQDTDISSSTQSATQSPYLVRPDGKVSFPLVGEIDAKGMTVAEFTATLEKGLSRYYVDPDVAVNIVKLGTVRVFVFGEVKKPGASSSPRVTASLMRSAPPKASHGTLRRRKFSSSIKTIRTKPSPSISIAS